MNQESVAGFDYTAALHQDAGIARYVRELAAAIADSGRVSLRLFAVGARGMAVPPTLDHAQWHPSPWSERTHARLWHRLRLPLPVELWTGHIDLFHATDFTLPPTLPATRTILTIHDLAFERHPEDTMPGMLGFLKMAVPRSARRADRIIAVSEATRQDLIACYNLPSEKIVAIPHGVGSRFTPLAAEMARAEAAALRAKYHLPIDDFILSVGTLQPRKNHLRLVRALALMKHPAPLVIVGGRGWAYEPIRAEVERLGLAGRVIFAGFVDDADLPGLYRAASVFAYPALYEGFGMPVLEAMASGTPVLTSNVSALPEAAGDAAILADPLDAEAIAAGLDALLSDTGLRAELIKEGLARAAQFTWAETARRTLDLYDSILVSLSPPR